MMLKKLINRVAEKYSNKNINSKLCAQTIAIPWQRFMKEPIFLKDEPLSSSA